MSCQKKYIFFIVTLLTLAGLFYAKKVWADWIFDASPPVCTFTFTIGDSSTSVTSAPSETLITVYVRATDLPGGGSSNVATIQNVKVNGFSLTPISIPPASNPLIYRYNWTAGTTGVTHTFTASATDTSGNTSATCGTTTFIPGPTATPPAGGATVTPTRTPTPIVTPGPTPTGAPDPPTVTADCPGSSMTLSWAAVTGATGYRVTITGGTIPVQDAPVPGGPFTYDTTAGNPYSWWVKSCNNNYLTCGNSAIGSITCSNEIRPWIFVDGDVHSNTKINMPGGP